VLAFGGGPGEVPSRATVRRLTRRGARVRLVEGEAIPALETFGAAGERFDVVAVLGLFYHLVEHFRLLWLVRQLGPRLVILDSEFSLALASHVSSQWIE
jgi:hypothetical protein